MHGAKLPKGDSHSAVITPLYWKDLCIIAFKNFKSQFHILQKPPWNIISLKFYKPKFFWLKTTQILKLTADFSLIYPWKMKGFDAFQEQGLLYFS